MFHQGRLFALRAATNKDYLFISETNGDIFKTAWIIRTPSNRTGFTAIREFSINDDFLIILTDLCPTILTGNGINNFSLNAKKQYPGMRSNAPRCACLGIRGVYYLDNYMDITRFEGESAYNICRDTLGEYLRNDVKNSALDVSCMWADGRYVYFSYVSNEVSSSATAPNRILIYDENTQQWVGDLRLGTSTPSYVCPTFKRSLMLAYSFITVTPAATTASLLAKSNTPSTSVTSVIQTKEVTINPRNISDFDVIESVFDVANSGSNAVTADVSIDGTFLALNKSISLLTSGPRYGDEDGTTINRVGLIHYPWILDAKQCSGRRMGIKFTHSGYRDVTDFTLRYVMIDSFLSQIDEDKERIK